MSLVENLLLEHLPSTKPTPGGWLTMNCPMCVQSGQMRADTRHRGGLKIEGGVIGYHCFNCQFKTKWEPGQRLGIKFVKLLRTIGVDEGRIQRLKIQLWDEVVDNTTFVREVYEKPVWNEIEWPWEVTDITLPAAEYLDSRKILGTSNWFSSPSTIQGMNNRVILPYYNNGKIVGYAARWIGDRPNERIAKMLTSRPPNFVFNLDRQNEKRNYTIVVEGEYDALTVDGVAVMTNSISAEQAKIIEDIDNEPVVLADRDSAGKRLLEQAAELGWSASFPEWPPGIKDANEAAQHFGRTATLQSILASVVTSPLKIKLLSRSWCA